MLLVSLNLQQLNSIRTHTSDLVSHIKVLLQTLDPNIKKNASFY
jgi:hypothetical protein